ncbi:MAG: hypothetical protein GWP91_16520, partial [Rhodobacterales bacterium]|nr:hypothetical protein [Rhodobacterales bacterium]
MTFWCLLLGLSWGQEAPSDHTVVYYNARMALREGRPLEASKWWLLRNAMEDQTGQVSAHDPDFYSVTWAALGEMGICQDGFPNDVEGAGLWPVALHNWVVRNRSRRARAKPPRPFDAFQLGRQQRFISIGDVLGADEIQTVQMFRGVCTRPRLALLNAGESVLADLSDRQVSVRLLQYLLERARDTLVHERVRGIGTIEARLFDIHLQRTALAAREARLQENERARIGRQIGLSRDSVTAMRDEAEAYTFSPESEPARILRESVGWDASEWIALSAERRLFLYDHAKAYNGSSKELDRIALAVLDHLIDQEDGEGVGKWIAHRGDDLREQRAIWDGERGQRLMALDGETGFGERGVIALHRGVNQLEIGDLPSALRSMAYALQLAPESRDSEDVQRLSLRWLSYVASQFEITDELLITLQELIPRRDYAVILEDLMWGAAFRSDKASFERGRRHQSGHGALERRIAMLHPLAKGDVGRFSNQVRVSLNDSPSETLRFLDQLVQRLELEDADVRTV